MTTNEVRPFVEAWLAGADGHQFYTRTYLSSDKPNAAILFLHGFGEHVGRFEWYHASFAKRGILVFAFDQRGFGRTALDKRHCSEGSAYGNTNWAHQMGDVEYFLNYLSQQYPGVPLFLHGASMGGGLVLSFAARGMISVVPSLSGVIAASTLILQPNPPSWILRKFLGLSSRVVPWASFPVDIRPGDLSRNAVSNEAYTNDPYVQGTGTVRALHELLDGIDNLRLHTYKDWPQTLPVLIVHGSADKLCLFGAAKELYDKLPATDKTFSGYEDAYHELVNETDGIPQRLFQEVSGWIEARWGSCAVA